MNMAGKAGKDKADKPAKKKHRGHGEGTVYYRESRDDYIAQVTINGKRRTVSGKTQGEVIAKKNALEATVAKGEFVEKAKVTVAEWMPRWLNTYCKPPLTADTTFANYESLIRIHITAGDFGKKPLQKLLPSDIQRFLNDKMEKGRVVRPKKEKDVKAEDGQADSKKAGKGDQKQEKNGTLVWLPVQLGICTSCYKPD